MRSPGYIYFKEKNAYFVIDINLRLERYIHGMLVIIKNQKVNIHCVLCLFWINNWQQTDAHTQRALG